MATYGFTQGVSQDVLDNVEFVAGVLASQYGVDQGRLTQIMLATMMQESGGNPQAVGDNGTSFGLFQLHEGGELGTMTEQQAFNPGLNAKTAGAEIASVLRANPEMSDGQIAAAAQRPADQASYAASVNGIISGKGGSLTEGYDQSGANTSGTAESGGATGASTAIPGMSDMPALKAYITAYFPDDSWLLTVPDVASVVENAVANGDNSDQITAMLEQTNWWKTTSNTYRSYLEGKAENPGEYSFTIKGTQADQTLVGIKNTASQLGVQLTDTQAQTLAQKQMMYGWTSQQVQEAIGADVYYRNVYGKGIETDAQGIVTQLDQTANGQYFQNLKAPQLQNYAQKIAEGYMSQDQFTGLMQTQAQQQYKQYAQQLAQGYTMADLTSTMTSQIADALEISPDEVDYTKDPKYQKILEQGMTQSDALQYVKSTPTFGFQNTQTARDSAASLEDSITSAFGKVAS